ncbi:MAG TPA: DUF4242 domain-containing protein [Gillisia sp.]|nr:DUF4242 domain-containing protein [Gillisia sp.]
MKTFSNHRFQSKIFKVLLISTIITMFTACNNSERTSAETIRAEASTSQQNMYVIEREIPGASKLTQEELKGVSQVSNGVLGEMGTEIKWMHSYVAGDKIYCVYTAPNEEMVREHAKRGGFPANSVTKVSTVIDPSTGN